jgi:hypothetical protein
MSGNVSEWVMDVYRPLSPEDKSEFRPFRGNVFKTRVLNSDGSFADKHDKNIYDIEGVAYFLKNYQEQAGARLTQNSLTLLDQCNQKVTSAQEKVNERKDDEAQDAMQEAMDLVTDSEDLIAADLRDGMADYITSAPGEVKRRNVSVEENIDRRNYRKADYIDYRDGDMNSSIYYDNADFEKDKNRMYEWGATTLINDRARVYKGGNWRDRAYYTIPGTRRFLDERRSMSTLGFRCAMDRLGSPTGIASQE